MPYRDPDRQREAVRLRVARSRERARAAVDVTPAVTPELAPVLPPPAPPSPGEVFRLGLWLNLPRLPREDDLAYLARLRRHWRELRALLEGGEPWQRDP